MMWRTGAGVVFPVSLLLSTLFGCPTQEGQFLEPEEANFRIASSFALKDRECGVSHNFTVPVFAPVDERDVAACQMEIAAASCSSWNESNPAPVTCLALLTRLD